MEIPAALVGERLISNMVPLESYLLSYLSPIINDLSKEYVNTAKNVREKAQFSAQTVNEHVIKRNGMLYDSDTQCFIFKINFTVPLVNALSVNAKLAIKAIQDILAHMKDAMNLLNKEEIERHLLTYSKQQQIRQYIKQNHFCVFVADGSILPRDNGTNKPMKNVIPFN